MLTTVTDDLAAAAHVMGDAKTELWRLVRAGEVKGAIEQGREVERLCEDFRRRFFPRAREVVVTCDHEIGQPLDFDDDFGAIAAVLDEDDSIVATASAGITAGGVYMTVDESTYYYYAAGELLPAPLWDAALDDPEA